MSEHEHYESEEMKNLTSNAAFCDAMHAAIEAGLEHPPLIGIDMRPGTKNPRIVIPDRPAPLSPDN